MPNPKKKHTRHRTGIRRGAWVRHLSAASTQTCPNCGQAKLAHHACGACGFYDGRLVLAPKQKQNKKEPPQK